jgi:pimeloyl-ACP methyl ester carboxylesterase
MVRRMKQRVTLHGAAIAYADQGAGLPVLCLPGQTRTMADFDYLAPHLPPLRLIRMDYRGRGDSAWTGAATYTVAQEAADVLALLDHLALAQVAILGTSRGGLIAMVLAAMAPTRLLGVCFNDIGPVVEREGLARIGDYVGRNPTAKTHAAMAKVLAKSPGFTAPASRWLEEAQKHYVETEGGLRITYDPALRESYLAGMAAPPVDLWPCYDALAGIPVALIRGANSDLLSQATADEMARRHPSLIFANVPNRAHIPFLDEPESLDVIHKFLRTL